MGSKVFVHVVVNFVLIALVAGVVAVSVVGTSANVFSKNDYGPIYRGKNENQVALMINVYWGTEYLDEFLEIFKKYDVKATFFVGGCWAAKYPDALCKIAAEGHEIGNHGYYHKEHSKLNYHQNAEEMLACSKLVFEYCGIYPTLFAPPSGDFSNETLRAAKDNGFKTIMWSRDTIDWRDKDAKLVYTRATKNTSGGELILMHLTEHTLQSLESVVKYYKQLNLQPVTVGEIIGAV